MNLFCSPNLKHHGLDFVPQSIWWTVLYYILLPPINIFLKHSILSTYMDISFSEFKLLFYFLSVMASIMSPKFAFLGKIFFTIFLRFYFLFLWLLIFQHVSSAATLKNPSMCQLFFHNFTLYTWLPYRHLFHIVSIFNWLHDQKHGYQKILFFNT